MKTLFQNTIYSYTTTASPHIYSEKSCLNMRQTELASTSLSNNLQKLQWKQKYKFYKLNLPLEKNVHTKIFVQNNWISQQNVCRSLKLSSSSSNHFFLYSLFLVSDFFFFSFFVFVLFCLIFFYFVRKAFFSLFLLVFL